jgi:hypothetical protein
MTLESRPKPIGDRRGKLIQNLVRFSAIIIFGLLLAIHHANVATPDPSYEYKSYEVKVGSRYFEFIFVYLFSFSIPAAIYALIANISFFRFVFIPVFSVFGPISLGILSRNILESGPKNFQQALYYYHRLSDGESRTGEYILFMPGLFFFLLLLETVISLTKETLAQRIQVSASGKKVITQKAKVNPIINRQLKWIHKFVRFFAIIGIGLALAINHAQSTKLYPPGDFKIEYPYTEFEIAYFLSFLIPAIIYVVISNFSFLKLVFIILFSSFGPAQFSFFGRQILNFGPRNFQEAALDYSKKFYREFHSFEYIFLILPSVLLFLIALEVGIALTKETLTETIQAVLPGEPT